MSRQSRMSFLMARTDGDASYEPSRSIFPHPFIASMYLIARVQPPHPTAAPAASPHETGQASLSRQATEENMKRIACVCAALFLLLLLIPAVYAQSNQVVPGTQVR